ncbi:uncharacterized protein APUU_10350A [Aspergillus puulaauensis]|uniref:Uncharacterized protein n=1 Tax=Aspergillus puulaauensis TaxID=1220207 RepID=A0A7R7X9W8_9EURO|nr:uncharacterized protein APUU_10350A [Aspergillus puulaauensis]BCS17522.1 hypothetical protein APUU_10350A [Aspergillus puulaauensis]
MNRKSENNAGAFLAASKPTNPVDIIARKSSGFGSGQTPPSATSARGHGESAAIKSPWASQESIQSSVNSLRRNPENNYYRQHACRVSRRVSVLDDTPKSYCRSKPERPNSRSRRFLDKMRAKIQIPVVLSGLGNEPQEVIPNSNRGFFLPSRALLLAESRREYPERSYYAMKGMHCNLKTGPQASDIC